MTTRKPVRFFLSLAVVTAAASIGTVVTYPAIPTWYAELSKPFFSPPNWLFGPVWTMLYLMMAVSLYLVWSARTERTKRWALVAFAVQLILNTSWSIVFFGLQLPWAAVAVIVAMWLAIAITIALFWPISRVAACLLIPYLVWVSFATALNISVAMLNPANPVSSYAECEKARGSVILDSYPSICMTHDKKQFTNPDHRVDQPASTTLGIPEIGTTIPLTSGIADAYYNFDGTTGEVYLTTTKLEDALKSLGSGCTAGLRGLYIKQEAGQLKEQPRIEILCAPLETDKTRQIKVIQDLLRTAITRATSE